VIAEESTADFCGTDSFLQPIDRRKSDNNKTTEHLGNRREDSLMNMTIIFKELIKAADSVAVRKTYTGFITKQDCKRQYR
jgi:hypothetical protein